MALRGVQTHKFAQLLVAKLEGMMSRLAKRRFWQRQETSAEIRVSIRTFTFAAGTSWLLGAPCETEITVAHGHLVVWTDNKSWHLGPGDRAFAARDAFVYLRSANKAECRVTFRCAEPDQTWQLHEVPFD